MNNLNELEVAAHNFPRMVCAVKLDATVCAASHSDVGALLLQDETGCYLLELGRLEQAFQPGDLIRIESPRALLRQRALGLELTSEPVVDDDGAHGLARASGSLHLEAGVHPVRVDWFNCLLDYGFSLSVTTPDGQETPLVVSNAQVQAQSPASQWLRITNAECCEGYWESVPEYELYRSVWSGAVTNLNLDYKTRSDMVALRFFGTFTATKTGDYRFSMRSDDGSLLFIGEPHVSVSLLGHGQPPACREAFAGEGMSGTNSPTPLSVRGRIQYASSIGKGMEILLESGAGRLRARLLDSEGIDRVRLTHRLVQLSGLGHAIRSNAHQPVLGELVLVRPQDVVFLDEPPQAKGTTSVRQTAEEVQQLSLAEALARQPVRLRGVVTSSQGHTYLGFTLQDETRGIYVDMRSIPQEKVPSSGDYCELQGHTGPGDFAPVVLADHVAILGTGLMPEPLRPGWDQFVNGSIDSQWAEFRSVVAAVHSNSMTLILPEGRIEAVMDRYSESQLKQFLGAQIRVRSTLFASWDKTTREVQSGRLLLRNATVEIENQALQNPFDAPAKSVRELLQFDIKSFALEQIRIRGIVLHASHDELVVADDTSAIRVLPQQWDRIRAGDLIEACGYPELGGLSPLLHNARVRKIGSKDLPAPLVLTNDNLLREGLDGMLVRIEARLLGGHTERDTLVFEMQHGVRAFQAHLDAGAPMLASFRPGSVLSLTGVYTGVGGKRWQERKADSFNLLLSHPGQIQVVSTPPWWTLTRLLTLLGVLLLVLLLFLGWIHQLRRQVEIRTQQLKAEIRERESAERERALEAERSRIARDLHDDLGSSLTEISVIATLGQFPMGETPPAPDLFGSISQKARNLITALDSIVWAVDPAANSLQSLADYLSGYANDYFSCSDIKCRFKVPVSLPKVLLNGRVRHNLFLSVKEALHNVLQHSGASMVEFKMSVPPDALEIGVSDDGKGFEAQSHRPGHGLKNLEARIRQIGGDCQVHSRPGQGTQVLIHLPLPPQRPDQ